MTKFQKGRVYFEASVGILFLVDSVDEDILGVRQMGRYINSVTNTEFRHLTVYLDATALKEVTRVNHKNPNHSFLELHPEKGYRVSTKDWNKFNVRDIYAKFQTIFALPLKEKE